MQNSVAPRLNPPQNAPTAGFSPFGLDLQLLPTQELLALANSRCESPLAVELAARLTAVRDAQAETDLLRARHAQAKAALEVVLYRYGAPGEVTAALKKVLSL